MSNKPSSKGKANTQDKRKKCFKSVGSLIKGVSCLKS